MSATIDWILATQASATFYSTPDVLYTTNNGSTVYGSEFIIGSYFTGIFAAMETFCTHSSTLPQSAQNFATPLKMIRNDTFSRTFTVVQDSLPFDLTNYRLRFTAKWSPTDLDVSAVITLTSLPGQGISIQSAEDGIASFTITPAMTSSLPPYRINLFYDIQASNLGDPTKVYTVAYGTLSILPDISITTP